MEMTRRTRVIAASTLLAAFVMAGCGPEPVDPEQHRAEIESWREYRNRGLAAPDGWLTLIGLSWLSEGENRCGSDPANAILLPADRAPGRLGTFMVRDEEVRFTTSDGVVVTHESTPVSSLILRNDHHDDGPTILRHGSLSLYVIKRGDELAVRVKDSLSATRLNFEGLSFFPIDLKWRVEATFHPFPEPKTLDIPALTGPAQRFTFPGSLSFTIDGQAFTLDAAIEEGMEHKLFLMFGDETNGIETYGAGRQLYTDLPDERNRVVLDFNRAYNWPCVFTEFSTCPLPPEANLLKLRVEAGEQVPADHEKGSP